MNYKTTWNEKYRPTRLSHVVGQNMTLFENIKKTNQMTNLIIYGKAGVGKTSAIIALAYELYKEKVEDAILEVNASENRGIEIVREKILQFSKLITPTETPNFKIIILDEADALTNECQNALRRVIEEAINTRFVFICNNVHKIIEPLKSRCVMIKFKQIKPEFCIKKLMDISRIEKLNIPEDAITHIIKLTDGDLRESILFLQNLKFLSNTQIINEQLIYEIKNIMPYDIFKELMLNIKNIEDVLTYSKNLLQKGYLLQSILNNFITYTVELDTVDNVKANIFLELSNVEKNINNNADTHIILIKLLSIFIQ
jgi:replication factor C subunit 2/4